MKKRAETLPFDEHQDRRSPCKSQHQPPPRPETGRTDRQPPSTRPTTGEAAETDSTKSRPRKRDLNKQIDDTMADLSPIRKTYQEAPRHVVHRVRFRFFEARRWLELPVLDAFNLAAEDRTTCGPKASAQHPIQAPCCATTGAPRATRLWTRRRRARRWARLMKQAPRADVHTRHSCQTRTGKGPRSDLTLNNIYGILLADEGVLNPEAVDGELHARPVAGRDRDDGHGRRGATDDRDVVEHSLAAAKPADARCRNTDWPEGDVLVEIGGDIDSLPGPVRRKLLDNGRLGGQIEGQRCAHGYPHPFVTHPRLDLYLGSPARTS